MNIQRSAAGAFATLRGLVALGALCATGALFAQALNNVPMAVKNNVAPNFMFMVDNSGSMSNIVPTAPYNAAVDYTPSSNCSVGHVVAAGTSVDLRVSGGVPYIRIGGTSYSHSTASSGTRRCFTRNATYGARLLADNAGSPSDYLDADYTGNYLNWYFGNADGHPLTGWTDRKVLTAAAIAAGHTVQTRLQIAKTSTNGVIGSLPASATSPSVRVGLSAYNGDNGGTLRVAMGDLTPTLVSTLQTSVNGLTASGATPLAETLADIGRYMATGYSGNITADWVTGVSIDNFLKQGRNSCLSGANCLAGTTDAVPASPSVGTPNRPTQLWCQRSYAFLMTDGRPQQDQAFSNNNYLKDYDRDCTGPNAVNCTSGSPNYDRKVARSYESAGSDYLDDVAKALFDVDLRPNLPSPDPVNRPKKNNVVTYTIGFADLQVQNDPLLINTALQGGGRFFNAQDGTSLTRAFGEVVTDAFAKDAAAAAVAVANAQITLNNNGYASSYRSGAWYGDLVAYSLDTTTALQTGPDLWSLRAKLDAQTPGNRKIATYNGSGGAAFAAGLAYSGKPASLTDGVINYLRGDRSGEGTTYRSRQSVLGDIINAEPVVVTYGGSVPIIFQGANDGMLHVVDGRTDGSVATRGQELWAYVPKLVHNELWRLTDLAYEHRYYMDATPATADVTGVSGVSKMLVGGLGKGGAGYYALNISDYAAATQADAVGKVMWEFTHANMGYSFGTPLIVKTAAGWRVLVTSGYDDGTLGTDGRGYVWVLDPANGSILATLSTGVGSSGSPAGLAHLGKLANTAPDALVRYVWGGDLLGNVWRFDLDTNSVTRIAALTDAGGTLAQPVTSPPEVGPVSGSSTKFMVYLGTGRYLHDEDVPGAGSNAWSTQRQTVYAVLDDTSIASPTLPNLRGTNGATCPAGGGDGDLVCQSLTYVGGTNSYQATTHPVNLTTKRGWYVDLPQDARLTHGRVVSKASLTTGGTLALTVNIPTNVPCDPGGRSWFLALNSATGGAIPRNVGGNTYYDAVATFLADALASRTVIVLTADGKRALIRLSDKTVKAPEVPEAAAVAAAWRRIYWRPVNR